MKNNFYFLLFLIFVSFLNQQTGFADNCVETMKNTCRPACRDKPMHEKVHCMVECRAKNCLVSKSNQTNQEKLHNAGSKKQNPLKYKPPKSCNECINKVLNACAEECKALNNVLLKACRHHCANDYCSDICSGADE